MADSFDYAHNPIKVLMPNLIGEEFLFIREITQGLSAQQLEDFTLIYEEKRRQPIAILLLSLVGLGGFAGLQRFYVKQYFWGVMYILTFGFLGIGTIYDIFNYREKTLHYNYKVAIDTRKMLYSAGFESNFLDI